MYHLTLTYEERRAIDWIGDRYSTGYDFKVLLNEAWRINNVDEDDTWNCQNDMQFNIAEHTAWEMCELFEEEGMLFPCFDNDLRHKLIEFYEKVI